MHIEFKLPTGAGGQAAIYGCSVLNRELEVWCKFYGFTYMKTVSHYKILIEFTDPRAYTVFALSWQLDTPRFRIRD